MMRASHLFALLILALTATLLLVRGASVQQNYIDDEDGSVKSFDPNVKFGVKFSNLSKYRADIHYDDGRFGAVTATVDRGGEVQVDTLVGHRFFVTRHGVREGLVDPETDEQFKFEVLKPHQVFVIPGTATTSKKVCQDRYPVCKKEAARGECTNNPGWMIVHCCESCDDIVDASRLIDPKVRCTRENLNMTEAAWKPGDLNKLFTSWATEERFARYEPKVLSSPDGARGGQDGPWVMIFDNFLSDAECDALVEGGRISGFEQSTNQGAMNALGERERVLSKTRTSSNAWCNDVCENLDGVKAVTDRIEDITGVPRENYESFQILSYELNQFYRTHHDSSGTNADRVAGHRIMTFFLYLSDVEEGGETHFSRLGLSVSPKKGRALVWPSVTDADPDASDPRMYHEAKDVIKGKKYAANHWIHNYNYVLPNKWGCTGSFS